MTILNIDISTMVQQVVAWLIVHGLRVVGIVIIASLLRRFVRLAITRAVRQLIAPDAHQSKDAETKRENTLIQVIDGTTRVLIGVVAAMMILAEVGIEVGPLLAAAGVVGVALGFGGQYLIRDVIAGLFIIMENQYRVGDVVSLDGTSGSVEELTLRATVLRDMDGTVHHVQNGTIKKASNLSKDFARVNFNVGVSYDADLALVEATINRVGMDLANDEAWKEKITEPPRFLRIQEFGDSAVMVKIFGKTKPLAQWEVTGEYRRRLKTAFDEAGIEFPYPQQVVHRVGG
jgi:moderate conductance mechanosensitive channel